MLFLPDDGFDQELQLCDEFMADSLFEVDDCVLTDVSLSDALTDRLGYSTTPGSLHSDGDSCPNSPLTEFDESIARLPGKSERACVKDEKQNQESIKMEPSIVIKQEPRHQTQPPLQPSLFKQPKILFRSRVESAGSLLCPKLMMVKSEPKKEENNLVIKSRTVGKTKSRRVLESCLLSSNKLSNGELSLTEEEKLSLLSEGYTVPARLPLSKAEERSLKKIRRKIRNKISAQESRRKKKEYLDMLELRCEKAEEEKDKWEARCIDLENRNRALHNQLAELKAKCITSQRGISRDIEVD